MFFCAISGEPPQDPVVSTKSGHVYERRLIHKYILTNGTEPTTGEKLEESDLISVKASPNNVAPRPPTLTSVPSLLHALQNEWDALMLETFSLKQQYTSVRQQLSHALYNQDAATRVVARLLKERDAAREALANVQSTIGLPPSDSRDGNADIQMTEQATEAEGALPKDIVAEIDDTLQQLSSSRKKRKPTSEYTTAAQVRTFVGKETISSLHSSKPAGITSFALSISSPGRFVSGGNDKVVQLYDHASDKVLATLKGHTKKIHQVALRERSSDKTLILSASADKSAKIWGEDSASGDFSLQQTISVHKADVTGLSVHPTSNLLCLASLDKTYSVHDLRSNGCIFHSTATDESFSSISVHPDGALLALGTATSKVHIYDIRSGALAGTLASEADTTFSVNTLSFSENGYHLLAPDSSVSAGIWDLRKLSRAHSISLGDSFTVNKVVYDSNAQYFGIAGSKGGRIFAHKSWEELLKFGGEKNISDVAFGPLGKEIWFSMGRDIQVWGMTE